jgi:hypothetical protein
MRFLRIFLVLALLFTSSVLSLASSNDHHCVSRAYATATAAAPVDATPKCSEQTDVDLVAVVALPALALWLGVPLLLGVILARRGIFFIAWRFR